jgi:hypothetical protein
MARRLNRLVVMWALGTGVVVGALFGVVAE